jgi:hypothetical protein
LGGGLAVVLSRGEGGGGARGCLRVVSVRGVCTSPGGGLCCFIPLVCSSCFSSRCYSWTRFGQQHPAHNPMLVPPVECNPNGH